MKHSNCNLQHPVVRWSQRLAHIQLTLPLNAYKYHMVQLTASKIFFLAVHCDLIENNVFELSVDLRHEVDLSKSGKKIAAQNELKIYLAKKCISPAKEIKPPTGPNGQEYPSHF